MDSFEFKIPFSMTIVSRRNCGKTHLMEYLTDNFYKINYLIMLYCSQKQLIYRVISQIY